MIGPMFTQGEDIELTTDRDDLAISSYMTDLYSDKEVNVTGVVGRPGYCIFLINVGTFNINLINNSASSGPGNKFFFKDDLTRVLAPGDCIMLMNKNHSVKNGWWELLS